MTASDIGLSSDRLVLPIVNVSGSIWMLDNVDPQAHTKGLAFAQSVIDSGKASALFLIQAADYSFEQHGATQAFDLLDQAAAVPGWEGKAALHRGRLYYRQGNKAAAAAQWRGLSESQLRDPADRKALKECLTHPFVTANR